MQRTATHTHTRPLPTTINTLDFSKRLNPAELGRLYTQFLPLAYKQAATFSRRYGVPMDDLIVVAEEALGLCITRWNETYNRSRGAAPITWIWRHVTGPLMDRCTRYKHRGCHPFSALAKDDQRPLDMPAPQSWLADFRRNLGEDARTLVETIINAPAEIIEDMSIIRKRRARQAVVDYLAQQGWDQDRINTAWDEVQECL